MRRKENSFLRLLFYGSGKGGENRNLNLLLREGMFANIRSFCVLYISLNFILLCETRSKWHRKRTLFLIKNKVRIRLYFVVFFCRDRKRIFAPNGNFGLPLNIWIIPTLKPHLWLPRFGLFPKGSGGTQSYSLRPFRLFH